MFSTTLSFFITSFLIHQVSSISLMEILLRSTIQSAQCEARCKGLNNQDDLQDCLDVCSVIIKNNDDSLCMFPRLCTGGCKVACQDQDIGVRDHSLETQISSLAQDHCQLSWEIDNVDNEKVVFIIAGLDHTDTNSAKDPAGEPILLTFFVALQDIDPSMGPTVFMPNTHNIRSHNVFFETGRDNDSTRNENRSPKNDLLQVSRKQKRPLSSCCRASCGTGRSSSSREAGKHSGRSGFPL